MTKIDSYIASIEHIRDYLLAFKEIQNSGCCNDCSKMRDCKYVPEVGKLVRYNCPYVKVPENLIVIDFDLKGGNGLHLHYIYTGDPIYESEDN